MIEQNYANVQGLTTSAFNGKPVFENGSGGRLAQYTRLQWKRGGTVDKPQADLSNGSRIGDATIERDSTQLAKYSRFPKPFRQGPCVELALPPELVRQFAVRGGDSN